MRILQIRFKNLNSLAGEWQIDLTDPAYTTEGIFAITGPTGAGKSTLLDAICLALYGRTPRQERVNASQNEVMSRQTGECFAEVVFETPRGRWRCHWSQHRSRKRADGTLQAPKHEVANADTGQVLTTRLREVAETIERETGMDFDRFTRSMLLAQGGFAAFLQADADERAPILEQITGTSIYSDISKAVHQRRGEEKQRLDQLTAVRDAVQLLEPEEEETLSRSLAELVQRLAQQEAQIRQQQALLHWRQQLDRETEQAEQLQQELQRLQQEQTAFAPELQRLELARQAEQLRPVYEPLRQRREDLHKVRGQLEDSAKEMPQLEQALAQAVSRQQQAEEALGQAEQTLGDQQPLLEQMRKLDWALQTRQKGVAELAALLPEDALAEPAPDPASLQAEMAESERALQAAREIGTRQETLARQEQLHERSDALKQLRTLVQRLDELGETEQRIRQQLADIDPALNPLRQQLDACQAETSRLQQEQRDLQRLQRLAERIADLEQQRHELEPGKPCPLCGSEQHPWRQQQPPELSEEKARLQRLEVQLESLSERRQRLLMEQTRLEQERIGLQRQEKENRHQRDALLPALNESLGKLQLTRCPEVEEIDRQLELNRNQWRTLRDHLNQLERLEKELNERREAFTRLQQRLELEAAEAELKRLQQQRLALSAEPDTRAFEQRLQQAVEEARQALARMQREAGEQQNRFARRQQQITDLNARLTALERETAQLQQGFDQALAASPFATETQVLAALLAPQALQSLQQQNDRLKERSARLQALQEQCQHSLQQLQQQALTEQSSAELAAALEQMQAQQASLQAERGKLQQTLDSNATRKQEFSDQQQKIKAQQRELERWSALHDLIGSADGKKFRNFAQGLTFELMISHANRQLQTMSDRYLLVRDEEQPLELNVIDNYQAGEVRSTKNLSGGESFLISLALALGLSGMASRNVRVDSLFLDEGFGTLDEEALETALNTLSGLQQEGKLIGVISHVQALKDRIATRIEVQPLSGGRSRLSGPGCRALSG